MSHTMNVKVELHDREALEAACRKLGLKVEEGRFQLYSSVEEGIGVYLPGWKYPVVIKRDGTVAYDNYGGQWGSIKELSKLKAYYGLEKAKIEARKKGYSVHESVDEKKKQLILRIKL